MCIEIEIETVLNVQGDSSAFDQVLKGTPVLNFIARQRVSVITVITGGLNGRWSLYISTED